MLWLAAKGKNLQKCDFARMMAFTQTGGVNPQSQGGGFNEQNALTPTTGKADGPRDKPGPGTAGLFKGLDVFRSAKNELLVLEDDPGYISINGASWVADATNEKANYPVNTNWNYIVTFKQKADCDGHKKGDLVVSASYNVNVAQRAFRALWQP